MKLKGDKNILTIAILTLVIVLTWAGFDIYRSITKPTLPKILEKQTRKLEPEFDMETLDNLKKRKKVGEEELVTLKGFIREASPSATTKP